MINIAMIIFSILFGMIFSYKPICCVIKSQNKKAEFFEHKNQFILSGITIIGCLFRTVCLGSLPAGLNQDEASIGYEAFSLAYYGIDRNGLSFPVHFISWGSGQNALYAYILIPFIKIFGLTTFSLRLPMALLGCVSIYVFYYLLKIILPKYAILGTFFFAINPWHIEKSRWALEANIFPDLFLIALLLFMLAINGKKIYYVLSGIVFGLATYSYGTSYFVLPVFAVAVLAILLLQKKIKLSESVIFLGTIFIVSLPMIIFVLLNYSEYESVTFLGVTIPKLYQNRQTSILNTDGAFFTSLFANIKTIFEILFVQYDGLAWNGMKFFGLTYVITTPLMIWGVIKSIRDKNENELPMQMWLASSVAMLLFIEANINRANILFIPMIYFTIRGVASLLDLAKRKSTIKSAKVLTACVMSILFVSFGFSYFGETHQTAVSYQFFDGAGEAMVYADENYDAVYVTSSINEPYITYLFYMQISPYEYLETREVSNPNEAFEYISQIGNFTFWDIAPEDLQSGECYICCVSSTSEYDLQDYNVETFENFVIISKK
ncbi:MAG: glycosyltransferase family 39 protein [Bacillota bacterium]